MREIVDLTSWELHLMQYIFHLKSNPNMMFIINPLDFTINIKDRISCLARTMSFAYFINEFLVQICK